MVAPEAANNAVMGGALIPVLSLGIPGDPATAIILGGLLLHGLQPGPMLFQTRLDVIYALYMAIIVSWTVILLVQLGWHPFVRPCAPGTAAPARSLYPRAVRNRCLRDPQLDF